MSTNIQLSDSHPFLASSQEVDAIVRPLKDAFGITSFVYHQNFLDGSEIKLTNQPAWIKHFCEQGYFKNSGFEKHPDHYQPGFVVWSHLSHHQPVLNAAKNFNIAHGMTIIQKNPEGGVEFYFLGTTPDKPHVTNLLLNNMSSLERFIIYFKQKAASLIKNAYAERLIVPDKYQLVSTQEQGIAFANTAQPTLTLPSFAINNVSFTNREIACAKLLLKGNSARLIGEQLFLSRRTVETHLQNLKDKLQCRTKAELISQLITLKIEQM